MNHSLRKLLFRLQFQWRSVIGQHPGLMAAWLGIFYPRHSLGVLPRRTDLVIEGYPRSGNWFAWYAFALSQSHVYDVAHHSHRVANIIAAASQGIPTLVLIRRPDEAVASYKIFQPQLSLELAVRHWIRYYRALLPYRQAVRVAEFEQVTRDYGQVIQGLNRTFGTNFELFEHSPENVERVFHEIDDRFQRLSRRLGSGTALDDMVSRPSAKREEKKQDLLEQLHADTNLSGLLQEADRLYQVLVQPPE